MRKTALLILLVYFAVAGLIFASDWFSPEKPLAGEKITPMIFSVVLLIPLFVWYRYLRKNTVLSQKMGKAEKNSIWLGILALFFLAMAVRLPSVLLFGNVYEKTPLIFLIVLTVILLKKENPGLYGFRSEKFGRALLVGLIYYLVYGLVGFFILNTVTFAYVGQALYEGINFVSFLLVFPFMIFCVGMSEESLFRGFMQTRLGIIYSWKDAIFIQAGLFGVWHFVWHLSPLDFGGMMVHIFYAFVVGLIFGYFYHISKTLTPLILAHGLIDSVPYGLVTSQAIAPEQGLFPLMQLIALVVSLIILAVSTKFLADKIRTT
jgi:membrane protease YdiL (CAAX protease family)